LSSNIIKNLIEEQIRSGIKSERIIVGGFSQGGAIAFFSSLTCKNKLGGVMILSSYLPLKDKIQSEMVDENKLTPFIQCHGKQDMVVQYGWGQLSFQYLKLIRGNIEFYSYEGMGHSSSTQELSDIEKWISNLL
jgi:predicted esterase